MTTKNQNINDEFFRKELYTLLVYSSLLKKKRSKKADEEVKKVLEEEKTIVARINKIKEIDQKYEEKEESTEEIEGVLKPVIENIEKETKVKKTSFLSYFFGIRQTLVKLAHDTGIIKPKFFGISFKATSESLALLEEIRVNIHNNILRILWEILEKGWLVLNPSQYNLFYYFYEFLSTYVKNFNIKEDIDSNFNFIQTFLSKFLIFFSKKYYIQEIREAAYIFYNNKENDDLLKLLLFIEGLTDTKKSFSFTNYISMIYSAYYKKIISFKKITETEKIDEISTTTYIIPPRLKDFIEDHINKIKSKQKVYEKRLFRINYVLDDNSLETFIKKYSNPKFDPSGLKLDILTYTKDFLNSFINYGKPILLEPVTLIKDQELISSPIFRYIFNPPFNNLINISMEINYIKENYKFLLVPLSKYNEYIKQGKKLESEKDEKICSLVDSVVKNIYDIFETLITILYNHHKTLYEETNIVDKIKTKTTPLSDITKEGFLPYYDYTPKEYNNENVWDIVSKLALVSGNFLYKIGHPKIIEEVNAKESIITSVKSNIEIISRFTNI